MPQEKLYALIGGLRTLDGSIVAYSGGVDSSLLVLACRLAGIRFLAVTSASVTMPALDLESAGTVAGLFSIPHLIIRADELARESFASNPPDRCFHCKDMLFGRLREIARIEGYDHVLDGSNTDDLRDHRPGFRARDLHRVRSPLIEAGLSKNEVREVSRFIGLPTWDRPSSPCLSSRFPHGQRITETALRMVEAAEAFLREAGFITVRVRTSGRTATIEVGEDEVRRFVDGTVAGPVREHLTKIGYTDILVDADGYRQGNMNRPTGHGRRLVRIDQFPLLFAARSKSL